jgi:hypothetical protein
MNKGILSIARYLTLVLFGCSGTPLQEYVPRNQYEAEVLALMMRYQDARSRFDLEGYLGCLAEDGLYHHASRVMVTKKALSNLLPDFWRRLQRGDRLFFPMCRENISGNYFVRFRLINPRIRIDRNTANVVVTYANRGWRLKHYVILKKNKNGWLIDRLDWETG